MMVVEVVTYSARIFFDVPHNFLDNKKHYNSRCNKKCVTRFTTEVKNFIRIQAQSYNFFTDVINVKLKPFSMTGKQPNYIQTKDTSDNDH